MTAPQAGPPQILPRPARTPAAVQAVPAANADDAVLRRYDQDLDMAFEWARAQSWCRLCAAGGSRRTHGVILWAQREFLAHGECLPQRGAAAC
jgi:hypothetical protein